MTAAYAYELPAELIAQAPAEPRDACRLMVLEGTRPLQHRTFRELGSFLRSGDLLVLNETRVIAARIFGTREPTGGKVEFLLLHPAGSQRYSEDAVRWTVLARPARRLNAGERVRFEDARGPLGSATVVETGEGGIRTVAFELHVTFAQFLERGGRLPMPPYVKNDSEAAQRGYQTVFARVPGSVAAPTASLHFTPELLADLVRNGVELARLTLDVGLATFRPMQSHRIDGHAMHGESYEISPGAVRSIVEAKRDGRRVVAAGTTVVRALEGNVHDNGVLTPGEHVTNVFITPGFRFQIVDALVTNFHLPRSTLLVLTSAFAGRERMLDAYAEAVRFGYRFFSFGDAMLVVP